MTATIEEPRPAARERGLAWWVIAGGVLAGLALRAWVLRSPLGGMDNDEAVSALVSRQILHGHFLAFIPQLEAGGTLLAWPRALVLAVFGPNRVLAKGVEVVAFAAGCVVIWRLGNALFGARAGQLAGLVAWVYPPTAIWESTKIRLYYIPAMILGTLTLLLCVRLYKTSRLSDLYWLGLVAGLAVWIHPMALYVAVPAVVWLLVNRPRLIPHLWRGIPLGIVGALPWIVFNLRHDFASFDQPAGPPPSTYAQRLSGFFDSLLPRELGLRHQFFGNWYLAPLSVVAYFVVLGSAVWALRHWHGAKTILLATGLAFPLLFAYPNASILNGEPRYGITLLPVLAVVAGYLVAKLPRPTIAAPAVLIVASLVSLVSLQRVVATTSPGEVLRPPPTGELWDYLDRTSVDRVYTDHWIGYRLEWEDRRPLLVLPIGADYYQLTVHSDGLGARVAVFYRGSARYVQWVHLLDRLGVAHETDDVGAYQVVRTPSLLPVSQMLGVLDAPTGAG